MTIKSLRIYMFMAAGAFTFSPIGCLGTEISEPAPDTESELLELPDATGQSVAEPDDVSLSEQLEWSIEIETSRVCEPSSACWRTVSVNSAGDVALSDADGILDLSDYVSEAELDTWAQIVADLADVDCEHEGGQPADLTDTLDVSIIDRSRAGADQQRLISSTCGWHCFRQGGDDPMPELLPAYLALLSRVEDIYTCPAWSIDEPSFGPAVVNEDTPRYLCAP
jgi:hypothetical protein